MFVHLCRQAVIKAMDKYFIDLAIPPSNAGESLRKAIKSGFTIDDDTAITKGQTRGQSTLIELRPPAGPQRYWEVFALHMAAGYCDALDPPIDDGTWAQLAVLGVFLQKEVRSKLLSCAKVRMQRLTFRPLVRERVTNVYDWLREGNFTWRSKFLRALAIPPGDPPEDEPQSNAELLRSMSVAVVSTLLEFAKGREPTDTNSYGFLPYGKPASYLTSEFKTVPSAYFGHTLAGMYPYATKDKDEWGSLDSKFSHPITNLWPWSSLRRFISFASKFRVSSCYEFHTIHPHDILTLYIHTIVHTIVTVGPAQRIVSSVNPKHHTTSSHDMGVVVGNT